MTKLERTIVQTGSAVDVAEILLSYARAAGLRAEMGAEGGSVVLRGGEPLAFNPNTLRRILRVEGIAGPGAVLTVSAEAEALPWERPRVRRALEGHLESFARRLEGAPADVSPFAFCAAPARIGAPAALGGILLSGLCAVLASMLVMGAYGLIQINEAAVLLAGQAARIEALGEIPIPGSAALAALSTGDRLAAAAFYAVPLGWLGGALLALAWGLGEIVPRWSGLGGLAALLVLLESLVFLVAPGPVLPGLLAVVLLPAAARIGYGIPWSLRRLIPAAAGAASPRPWRVVAVLSAVAALAAGVGLAFYRLPGLNAHPERDGKSTAWEESAVGFRDRVLLGTAWGLDLADFYYRHTYLPAERIRHPRASHQRLALVLGDPGPLTVSVRLGRQWWFYPAQEKATMWFYVEEFRTPGGIAERLRPPPELVVWIPAGPDPERDPFFAAMRESGPEVASRLVIVGGAASLVSAGGPLAGARRVELPVRPEALAGAIGAVLDRQDRAGGPAGIPLLRWVDGLRGCLGIALFSLVLGAGLLLPALVAWSAWAWGALGAAAAPGPVARCAAWVAGPAAALAAWGALGWVAVGDGPGLCRLPAALKDPFRAFVSGSACERLDAVQQMAGGLPHGANYATSEAQAYLRGALRDSDPRVRFWAAAAVGDLRHRGSAPALVERLRDPDLRVRYRAARSLGMLADAGALEPLRDQVRNDIWYAADYARVALRQIAIQRGGASGE